MNELLEFEKTKSRVISGTQSNHASWLLPKNVSHLNSPPLWLAVAWWSFLNGGAVTRNNISEAFLITQRRAGDVLYYVANNCQGTVDCYWEKGKDINEISLHVVAVNTTIGKPKRQKTCSNVKVDNNTIKLEADKFYKNFLTQRIKKA